MRYLPSMNLHFVLTNIYLALFPQQNDTVPVDNIFEGVSLNFLESYQYWCIVYIIIYLVMLKVLGTLGPLH